MITDKEYCMSSFLMYRRVVDPEKTWGGVQPRTIPLKWKKTPIRNSADLEKHLRKRIALATKDGKAALALSGGIDSAILAKFMPKGSTAYTFKCIAGDKEVVDETKIAARYAAECGLNHKIVEICWEDVETYAPILMLHKNSPIHSIEVQIYCGGLQAKKDGFERVIYGETADVNYGGLSNILSRDWRVGEFIERYAYLKPWMALKCPKVDFSPILEYESNGFVDVHKYLSQFDIIESLNSYVNACETSGVELVAPYADTHFAEPLDMRRIRSGESKYIIRDLFQHLYGGRSVPAKIPMPRPVEEWLADWNGPIRAEFWSHCIDTMTGDQKWLVWALERFLNLIDCCQHIINF